MSSPQPQFRFNPITGKLDLSDVAGGGGGGSGILTITGDSGGPVPADSNNNIDLKGSTHIDISGTPSAFEQQISLKGFVQFHVVIGGLAGGVAQVGSTGNAGDVLTSQGALLPPIFAPSGFTWNVVTSVSNPISLVPSNGYIPKGAGVVDFILPAAANVGDTFKIAGYGNLWTLAQNALQSITLGSSSTSVGVLGSVTATQVRDSIELVCVTNNTEFQILNGVGNLTFA